MKKLKAGLMNYCQMMCLLLLIVMLLSGCAKTVTETKVQYIRPEFPQSLLDPCDPVPVNSISTNGDLLMSYISLQTLYAICSLKVSSISGILQSYDSAYGLDIKIEDHTDVKTD